MDKNPNYKDMWRLNQGILKYIYSNPLHPSALYLDETIYNS